MLLSGFVIIQLLQEMSQSLIVFLENHTLGWKGGNFISLYEPQCARAASNVGFFRRSFLSRE